jgi:hypothetical protein
MKNFIITNPMVLAWMDEAVKLDKLQGRILKGADDLALAEYACAESTLRSYLSGQTLYKKLMHGGFFGETNGGKFFNDRMRSYLDNPRWYTASYEPSGFLGWHEDTTAPGHFIMLTYSELGQGYFKYFDCETGQVIELPDIAGWQLRAGYFGQDQTDAWWHCACSDCPRWSWIYVWDTPEQLELAIKKLS